MPSQALVSFQTAIREVVDLSEAVHPTLDKKSASSLRLARAITRGQVVLLSSHFERYVYALNEEFIQATISAGMQHVIPAKIRLLHSALAIDEMASTTWERREEKIIEFLNQEAWIWESRTASIFEFERVLGWMKSPKPKNIVRYFGYWGVEDIFSAVTRRPSARSRLWLGVQELVDMRNKIAHGDYNAQATKKDIVRYVASVSDFCTRADRVMIKVVAKRLQIPGLA